MKRLILAFVISFSVLLLVGSLSACGTANPIADNSASPSAQASKQPANEPLDIDVELIGEDGNDEYYDLENVTAVIDSPLQGKTIYWLGSSVTMGAGSRGQSIPHFLAKTDGVNCVVEAVPGTTLQTLESGPERSYVSRMKASTDFDKSADIDAFFCQVSTNDCTPERFGALGKITPDNVTDMNEFDLSTAAGAVEYIIAYVHETWGCPVYFYSGSWFGDPGSGIRSQEDPTGGEHIKQIPTGSNYIKLIEIVYAAIEKWNKVEGCHVGIVDLFNDDAFNEMVSDAEYEYLMQDSVHPRKAGYLVWWLPEFQRFLYNELAAN